MRAFVGGGERQLSAVYMIGAGAGRPCKIGVSDNVSNRLRQLQNGHADKLRLWGVWYFASRADAAAAEKFLHRSYQEKRMEGEWFDVDPSWTASTVSGLLVVGFKQARAVCYEAVPQRGADWNPAWDEDVERALADG